MINNVFFASPVTVLDFSSIFVRIWKQANNILVLMADWNCGWPVNLKVTIPSNLRVVLVNATIPTSDLLKHMLPYGWLICQNTLEMVIYYLVGMPCPSKWFYHTRFLLKSPDTWKSVLYILNIYRFP